MANVAGDLYILTAHEMYAPSDRRRKCIEDGDLTECYFLIRCLLLNVFEKIKDRFYLFFYFVEIIYSL